LGHQAVVLVLVLVVCGHEAQEAGLATAIRERRVVPRPETDHCRGCAQGFRALCRARAVRIRPGWGQLLRRWALRCRSHPC
jgi:hypothetical protein